GAYLAARVRGRRLAVDDARLVHRLLGLIAVFVVISLAYGPAPVLFAVVRAFRCYGRAGLLAVGLWSVAAPVILSVLLRPWAGPPWHRPLPAALLVVALLDATRRQSLFQCYRPETPAW